MKNLINIIEKLKVNSQTKVHNRNPEDWTIETAEDGDIIMSEYNQFIYKGLDEDKKYCSEPTAIIYHVCYNISPNALNKLSIGPDVGVGSLKDSDYQNFKLSSKEECKELFNAIKQKGYEWDDKNLKLIKI